MHPAKNLACANPLSDALIPCIHQSKEVQALSTLDRHNGGLCSAVYEGCKLVPIYLHSTFADVQLPWYVGSPCLLQVDSTWLENRS